MRPTKLTPQLQAAIVARLEQGATYSVAAQCEGIEEPTFYRWMKQGASQEEGIHREFREAVLKARGVAEQQALAAIRIAVTPGEFGVEDWRAREAWLRLTNPDKYSPLLQVKSKVENELRDALDRLREELDPPAYERVLRVLSGPSETGEGGTQPDIGIEETEH